jgi:shikimate dehydrogenase
LAINSKEYMSEKRIDRYAVIGNPIAHSVSPQIHQAFAKQTQQRLTYGRLRATADEFAAVARHFFVGGGKGLNVTAPFKEQAFALCEALTERAEQAGAVNTLWLSPTGQITGDNTDGIGLLTDLRHHQIQLTDQRVLLIGAGGAACGVLPSILHCHPATLVITNRTFVKAQQLVDHLRVLSAALTACPMDTLDGQTFDLIINTTSCSLQNTIPAIADSCYLAANCYDLVYQTTPTIFLQYALAHGACQALDGFGMLVEQAAEAFFLWRGVRPDTSHITKAMLN